ncbi:hypothetical protein HDE_01208 [Halotydeus destructor]|nr:hypothetical protein HDE_01208 [Halotydeus destructor]
MSSVRFYAGAKFNEPPPPKALPQPPLSWLTIHKKFKKELSTFRRRIDSIEVTSAADCVSDTDGLTNRSISPPSLDLNRSVQTSRPSPRTKDHHGQGSSRRLSARLDPLTTQ